ncbi:hypothetical protein [Novosphingobium sp. THN1]|uniref:hypothetical protein n=1 Tax=Novosphingobium sp. THN1 TaxID=1016987 RepID=UPI001967EEF4|nr:hypothetical protein [Novosphingobium sp. THN1]
MARKFKVITIAAEGRDRGKSFLIVEKSAYDAEKWATRAMLALSRAGATVDEDAIASGALGILATGLDAFRVLPFDEAEPLLDEMMTCVHFVPDPAKVDAMSGRPVTRPLMLPDDFNDGDIEEVATLIQVREEVLSLHLGFSLAAVLSSMAASLRTSRQNTSTSPAPAEPASEPAGPA